MSLAIKGTVGYEDYSIKNVNLVLNKGDLLGLIGRSGSGKSTIIKSLVGLLPAKKFSVEGVHSIGYSPQGNALFSYLTVQENLNTFADLQGVPKSIRDSRIDLLLKKMQLTRHRSKRISQLSGGMVKRVDLAVALVHDPDVLVLDEPFNGLDVSLQHFFWRLLLDLIKTGKTVIVASHILEDLQKYCTCFGLVEKGTYYSDNQIKQAMRKREGTLQQFLARLFDQDLNIEEEQ